MITPKITKKDKEHLNKIYNKIKSWEKINNKSFKEAMFNLQPTGRLSKKMIIATIEANGGEEEMRRKLGMK